ncbi:MAG: hypothetical protein ACRDWI_12140 [Jiangellaceae bacterium]
MTTTLLGLALVAGASLVIWLFAPQLQFFSADAVTTLAHVAFVYATAALLSVGLGLATRSTAAALSSAFALMFVLPLVLQVVPYDWAVRLIELLPGSGASFFLLGEGPGDAQMTATSSSISLIAWSLSALIVGAWCLLRADADKS